MHLLRHWLHRRLRAKRFALLDLLLHTQSLSRQEILRKQKQDVADIVSYAARNTTYYAEKFAPLMNNRVAEEAVPLGALPILSKEDVRGRLDDLLALV